MENPGIPTSIGRLLEELSWEGNATHYRGGGRGRENVLTTEVFSALDFLPRTAFLGGLLRSATGATAAARSVAVDIEDARITLLPGDVEARLAPGEPGPWTVQPDVRIESDRTLCLVEAKRIRSSSFGPEQIARSLVALDSEAGGRTALLLLVLGEEPPVRVAGRGRLSIAEAVEVGTESIGLERKSVQTLAGQSVAWTTWGRIVEVANDALVEADCRDPSVVGCMSRLTRSIEESVAWHA